MKKRKDISLAKMLASIIVLGSWGQTINLTTATAYTAAACFNKSTADWQIRTSSPLLSPLQPLFFFLYAEAKRRH